jgi:hypothetical protein
MTPSDITEECIVQLYIGWQNVVKMGGKFRRKDYVGQFGRL